MPRRIVPFSTLLGLVAFLAGCSNGSSWPPAPRDHQEKRMIESALRAVGQIDGWTHVACVVERYNNQWRVQAWRIVNPEAEGRNRCVPWAVRGITLDDDAKVVSYENRI